MILNLFADTKAEMKVAALFPVFNVSHKLYTISEGQVGITLGYDELLIYHSKVRSASSWCWRDSAHAICADEHQPVVASCVSVTNVSRRT